MRPFAITKMVVLCVIFIYTVFSLLLLPLHDWWGRLHIARIPRKIIEIHAGNAGRGKKVRDIWGCNEWDVIQCGGFCLKFWKLKAEIFVFGVTKRSKEVSQKLGKVKPVYSTAHNVWMYECEWHKSQKTKAKTQKPRHKSQDIKAKTQAHTCNQTISVLRASCTIAQNPQIVQWKIINRWSLRYVTHQSIPHDLPMHFPPYTPNRHHQSTRSP